MRTIILFLFLFIHSSNLFSQSKWQSYRHLSCPEKRWVIFHPFIANKARKITAEVIAISEKMKTDTTLDGDSNGGQVDAFRHAYWMAMLSQQFCWRKACSLGKAHEKGNYRQFKKSVKDEEGLLPDSASGAMDLFNNKVGVDLSREFPGSNKEDIQKLVINAIHNGKMIVISKNANGLPLDCSGKVIEMSKYEHCWNIPKCLVSSDISRK